MVPGIERMAMVAMHTSPAAQPGTADAGGLNVTVLGIAAELALRGVEVDLLTRAAGQPRHSTLLPGVALHELAAGPLGPLAKGRMPRVADEFGEAVAELARRRSYDLFHAHYWLAGIATLPVAIELGMPLVQSFHTLAAMKDALGDPSQPPEPEQRRRSESFLAHQADALIAASSAEATELIDAVGAEPDRTWIVPPGVDLALFSARGSAAQAATRRALGLDSGRQLVVIAGRVQQLKGHELAVRAIAELRSRNGVVPQLVVAGEATPGAEGYADRLRALVDELGVESDVRFVGALQRETLADLLGAAAVALVPSYSETFGLIALEAAAAGTPVIASRVGGLAESVLDGVSGVLLRGREPYEWASALAALLADDERRARFAVSARAHAERFTWGAAATSLLSIYAGLKR